MKKQAKKTKRYLVRCYDLGEDKNDRFTVVFSKGIYYEGSGWWFDYVGGNSLPTHPAYGIWQHGQSRYAPIDNPDGKHLGKRIPFRALPPDCQKLVLQDLKSEE